MRVGCLLALLLLAAALGASWALATGAVRVPDAWNPFAPLRIAAPPGALTRFKLMRVSTDPALCRDVLAQAQARHEPVEDRVTGDGCGFQDAVKIGVIDGVRLASPVTLSCRATVSLLMWERHVLQPAALRRFGQRVVRIDHFGSYACRNVGNVGEGGRRSRHATADALDIAGFVLADGRALRVARDWVGAPVAGVPIAGDDEEARLLREVHAGACGLFSTVLGPAHDAAHRDHFHVDRGSYGICR